MSWHCTLVDATHSAKCLSAFLIFPASLPLTAPSVIIPVTPIQTRKLLSPNITNLSYTSSKNKRLPLLRHSLALHPPCEPGEPSACGLQTQPAGQPMNWALSLIRHLELLGKYLPTPPGKNYRRLSMTIKNTRCAHVCSASDKCFYPLPAILARPSTPHLPRPLESNVRCEDRCNGPS